MSALSSGAPIGCIVSASVLVLAAPWRPRRARALAASKAAAVPPAWFGAAMAEVAPGADAVQLWRHAPRVGLGAVVLIAVTAGWTAGAIVTLGLAAGLVLSRPWLRRRTRQRRDQQLPEWLERVGAAVRGGASLPEALMDASDAAPEPLRADLQRVCLELRHGAAAGDAIQRWAGSASSSSAVILAAAALALGSVAGGEVGRALDRVAATLRERRQLAAEVHSLATQARASTVLLAVAPVGFTAAVAAVEPAVASFLLHSAAGGGCLAVGIGLEAIGVGWMARIVGEVA